MCKASIDFKQYQNAFLPKFVVTIKCQKQKIGGKTILLVSFIKMTYLGICTLYALDRLMATPVDRGSSVLLP